jgi:hypothetical protein
MGMHGKKTNGGTATTSVNRAALSRLTKAKKLRQKYDEKQKQKLSKENVETQIEESNGNINANANKTE